MAVCMQSRYTLAFQLSKCVLFLLTLENNIRDSLEMVLMELLKICCTLFTDKESSRFSQKH